MSGRRIRLAVATVLVVLWLEPLLGVFAYSLLPRYGGVSARDRMSVSANYASLNRLVPLRGRLVASLVIGGCVTTLGLMMALPLSFALARLAPVKGLSCLACLLLIRSVPSAASSYFLFFITRRIGLDPGLLPVVGILVIQHLPVAAAIVYAAAIGVTREVLWSAEIDGLSRRQASMLIGWRLVGPALGAAGVVLFAAGWNDYAVVQTFAGAEWRSLSADLPTLVSQGMIRWSEISAGGLIDCVPGLLATSVLMRGALHLGNADGAGRRE